MENTSCQLDNEINRFLKFGFPSIFRPLGITISAVTMAFLIISKFTGPTLSPDIKELLKYIILLGGFVAMFAKEKHVDERSQLLRGQAITVACVFAALQGFLLPVAQYVVDHIKQKDDIHFVDGEAFPVLFSLFFTYLLYHYLLKRFF